MRACRDANDGGLLATGAPGSIRVKGRKLPSSRSEDGVAQPVPRSPLGSAEPPQRPSRSFRMPLQSYPLQHSRS